MLLKMGLGVWLAVAAPICLVASSSDAESKSPVEGIEKFLDGLSAELDRAQEMLKDEKFREFLRKKYSELQKMGEVTTEEFRDLVEKFKKEYEEFKNGEESSSSSKKGAYI